MKKLLFTLFLAVIAAAPALADEKKKSIVLLPFGLIDSQQDSLPFPEKAARLSEASALLRQRFREESLYQVLESELIDAEIARQLKRYDFHDCNGCEREIAAVAKADRVLIGWVQRATALILNVNIEIRDGATGEVLLRKSSEIRGNTPGNWRRAVKHIVRSLVARNQGNL